MTFKERRVYKSPTEVVVLKQIVSIKSVDEGVDKSHAFVGVGVGRKLRLMRIYSYSRRSPPARRRTGLGRLVGVGRVRQGDGEEQYHGHELIDDILAMCA